MHSQLQPLPTHDESTDSTVQYYSNIVAIIHDSLNIMKIIMKRLVFMSAKFQSIKGACDLIAWASIV